jgi:hypothetical protein
LRAGLTREVAADAAWVIASPYTHDLPVRQAGYTYDQLEEWVWTTLTLLVKGTKISISPLIRSNARRCAALSHHGRKDVGARTSVPRFLHPVAPRVGHNGDRNTKSLVIA